jgi:flagellar brake protein
MILASDDSPYWLQSSVEIAYALNELRKSGAMLSAQLDGSNIGFVTNILQVDTDEGVIYLDAPPLHTQQDLLSRRGSLVLRNSSNGVRVEFELEGFSTAVVENAPALCAPIPRRILKVQRRSYFRVVTPAFKAISCSIQISESVRFSCRVLDLGLGGMALWSRESDPELEEGKTYDKCRIEFPDTNPLDIRLVVRHASEVRVAGKPTTRRYGCEFVELRSAQETLIQRMVLQLERERRAAG